VVRGQAANSMREDIIIGDVIRETLVGLWWGQDKGHMRYSQTFLLQLQLHPYPIPHQALSYLRALLHCPPGGGVSFNC